MVMSSQPAWTRSDSASLTSARVSPIPRIRLLLVTIPAARACVMTSRERS